jgi:hypothetical protein
MRAARMTLKFCSVPEKEGRWVPRVIMPSQWQDEDTSTEPHRLR